jgi:hypothetical protein
MSHFTSVQLPSGSPAIVDEPHAPAKAEAGEVADVDVADVDPVEVDVPPEVLPAVSAFPDGDIGLESLFSNAQPVATVEASSRLRRVKVFIRGPTVLYRHIQFWYAPQLLRSESREIEDST